MKYYAIKLKDTELYYCDIPCDYILFEIYCLCTEKQVKEIWARYLTDEDREISHIVEFEVKKAGE